MRRGPSPTDDARPIRRFRCAYVASVAAGGVAGVINRSTSRWRSSVGPFDRGTRGAQGGAELREDLRGLLLVPELELGHGQEAESVCVGKRPVGQGGGLNALQRLDGVGIAAEPVLGHAERDPGPRSIGGESGGGLGLCQGPLVGGGRSARPKGRRMTDALEKTRAFDQLLDQHERRAADRLAERPVGAQCSTNSDLSSPSLTRRSIRSSASRAIRARPNALTSLSARRRVGSEIEASWPRRARTPSASGTRSNQNSNRERASASSVAVGSGSRASQIAAL